MASDLKIFFVHPAVRQYRYALFKLLENFFTRLSFIFVEDKEDNLRFLEKAPLREVVLRRSWPSPFYSKGTAWGVLKEAVFGDYDVWVASGLNHSSTHLAFLAVKARGKKFVLFSEDWWEAKNFKTLAARPYSRFIARRSDAILAAGTRTKKFFLGLGVDAGKIFMALNATDPVGITPEARSAALGLKKSLGAADKTVILYLSRVVEYKGLDVLLEAFSRLEREFKEVFLVVAGEGPFKSRALDLMGRLKIKNVAVVGAVPREEAKKYFGLADIFCLPARFMWAQNVVGEAWGFVVNEALSSGLPVIVTEAVAAADDLIQNGIDGFTVKADNAGELYDAMRKLVLDKALRAAMSREALKMAGRATPQNQFEAFKEAILNLNRDEKR